MIDASIKAAFADPASTNSRIQNDRTIIHKSIQLLDAKNIQVGRSNGTMIGTAPDQKLALYGKTPVVQAGTISAPSGGTTVDSQSRTAITTIISVLKAFGLTN